VPVIFASSLLYIPPLIAQFNQTPDANGNIRLGDLDPAVPHQGDHPLYMLLYFLLIVGFTYFYVAITFNPVEVADNMKKYGGFIPGIRAGRPTAEYLDVLTRITLPGSIYLGLIALLPLVALATVSANQNFPFGGASILIIVGVGLETVSRSTRSCSSVTTKGSCDDRCSTAHHRPAGLRQGRRACASPRPSASGGLDGRRLPRQRQGARSSA
jgi:preprotein translocase subunit SecY